MRRGNQPDVFVADRTGTRLVAALRRPPRRHAPGDLVIGNFKCQRSRAGIDDDDVTFPDRGDRTAARGLRRDMPDQNAVRHSGKTAVGDQRDTFPEAPPCSWIVSNTISGMPGPPTGPTLRTTTTLPGTISPARIAFIVSASESKTRAVPRN